MTTEKTETSPVWPAGVIEAEPLNNLSDRESLHMRVSIGDHAQDVRRIEKKDPGHAACSCFKDPRNPAT